MVTFNYTPKIGICQMPTPIFGLDKRFLQKLSPRSK